MRSLTEFPGFVVSTFASTSAGTSSTILFNFTRGVFPIVSSILLKYLPIGFYNMVYNGAKLQ
jgi:hypothetical protein